METTKIVKIILERNGEERIAYPVSEIELQEVKEAFEEKRIKVNGCTCGQEVCHNGYVWRCAYGPSGRCQWFKSDWRCNN
jgi:hypothetical protein